MRKFLVLMGTVLLAAAILLLVLSQYNVHKSQQQAENYVQTLIRLIPKAQSAAIVERRNNTMSTLSIDNTDFVGILELPRYNSSLPVCNDWVKISKYPCRFEGSIYDGSLKIGATSQIGQYDFFREISVGDKLIFTDMEGNSYSLSVSDIRYSKQADEATLQREKSALTLFIKNIHAFEYIIIFCN